MPPKSLEFVGLPGSGKTFLVKALCGQSLAGCGTELHYASISKRHIGRVSAFARYTNTLGRALPDIVSILGKTRAGTPLSELAWRLKLLARLHILTDRRRRYIAHALPGVHVFDQAVVQSIASCSMAGLTFEAPQIEKILAAARYGKEDCIFVFHNAAISAALDSVYSRTGSYLPIKERLTYDRLAPYFEKFDQHLLTLKTALTSRGFTIIETDRDSPLDTTLNYIWDHLKSARKTAANAF